MGVDLKVAKFGGSSVKDAKAMGRCADLVCSQENLAVVVVSATQNTTNELELIAGTAKEGELEKALLLVDHLRSRHCSICSDIDASPEALRIGELYLEEILKEAKQLAIEISEKRKYSKKDMDALYCLGERMSSYLFSKLLQLKTKKKVILKDARKFIKTDSTYGAGVAQVDQISLSSKKELIPDLGDDVIIVTQGFIGSDSEGSTTTLGREGSDYSATLIGEAIDASEVQIWTDVEGVATFDPRLIDNTRFIPELSYEEASTLALLGAKVLYPKTLFPAKRKGIPVFVGSSKNPKAIGTRIHGNCDSKKGPRGLSFLKNSEGNLLSLVGDELGSLEDLPFKKVGESSVSVSYLIEDENLDKCLKELHELVLSHF
ncbi:MAG: aspartate kinase [Bacteriovoracaceae bacterium]